MDAINTGVININELLPGAMISLTARKGDKSYRFESFVLEFQEKEDLDYIKTLKGDYVIVEPIRVEDKIVKFAADGVSYFLIGNHKEKPYLFEKVFVDKINLPLYGTAHIIRSEVEGKRFNRRDYFRLWLGQHCNIALRGSKAQHDAMVKDISSTGVGLIVKKEYEVNVGDAIEIQFNFEKYNEHKEDYTFSLHTLLGEVVRVVDKNEKANLVGCKLTEGQEEVSKFIAQRQRERNRVGRKTNDLISMFVGKDNSEEN